MKYNELTRIIDPEFFQRQNNPDSKPSSMLRYLIRGNETSSAHHWTLETLKEIILKYPNFSDQLITRLLGYGQIKATSLADKIEITIIQAQMICTSDFRHPSIRN